MALLTGVLVVALIARPVAADPIWCLQRRACPVP